MALSRHFWSRRARQNVEPTAASGVGKNDANYHAHPRGNGAYTHHSHPNAVTGHVHPFMGMAGASRGEAEQRAQETNRRNQSNQSGQPQQPQQPTQTTQDPVISAFAGRIIVVRDNRGALFLIDTRTRTRYPITGEGQLSGATYLWGPVISQMPDGSPIFLTGWTQGPDVVTLYGGPGGIERVIAGEVADPLIGEVRSPVQEGRQPSDQPQPMPAVPIAPYNHVPGSDGADLAEQALGADPGERNPSFSHALNDGTQQAQPSQHGLTDDDGNLPPTLSTTAQKTAEQSKQQPQYNWQPRPGYANRMQTNPQQNQALLDMGIPQWAIDSALSTPYRGPKVTGQFPVSIRPNIDQLAQNHNLIGTWMQLTPSQAQALYSLVPGAR